MRLPVKLTALDTEATIHLLRTGAPAVRLFGTKLGPRLVSAREYESSFPARVVR